MADSRHSIEQLLLEARHRWLRPTEICQILQNYKKLCIAPEPPHLPPSGSLFLFDKKILRYFRKDGHNWRKKKDGKPMKEGHEKLKAGSIDVLHCYYAHGEDNENFQRRSYWLLEEDLSHIVLVHYLELKGNGDYFKRSQEANRASLGIQETQGLIQNFEMERSASFSLDQNNYGVIPEKTDTACLDSDQASEFDDVKLAYTQQASSVVHPLLKFQQPTIEKIDPALSMPLNQTVPPRIDVRGNLNMLPGDVTSHSKSQADKDLDAGGLLFGNHKQFEWENIMENFKLGTEFQPSVLSTSTDSAEIIATQGNELAGMLFRDSSPENEAFENHAQIQAQQQKLLPRPVDDMRSSLYEQSAHDAPLDRLLGHGDAHLDEPSSYLMANDLQDQLLTSQCKEDDISYNKDSCMGIEQNSNYFSMAKHLMGSSSNDDVLKKNDRFNRWMSKELGDVDDSGLTGSAVYWQTVESENQFDDGGIWSQFMLGPSLSVDQLFSIIDFLPNWAYAGSETKVLITGKFLKPLQDITNVKWSCMFGELEVPVDIIKDGILCCRTPNLGSGRVSFCITCSNRVACSELREFEYRDRSAQSQEDGDECHDLTSDILKARFVSLLLTGRQAPCIDYSNEISILSGKISSLIKDNDDDKWAEIGTLTSKENSSAGEVKDLLAEKMLKDELYTWLLDKASKGGKGPSVLDEYGQGVLHFAAALGYNWAFSPTIEAGVSINFRDIHGWTALHWAAFYGRERTVAHLKSLGAAPGALTDPKPKCPRGRTAADLASSNGHKGVAGYLAEADLAFHLASLKLKDANPSEVTKTNPVQAAVERAATPGYDGDHASGLSLKDSLAAVCNATQAAARMHQVFRVQSFQRKQVKEYQDSRGGTSDEDALSMLALKTCKSDHCDEPVQAAAVRIQNKFRSWKGRKDFLMIRQQIVKIQAHVRGHQARKNYKSVVWSVGIVDKFLHWRRQGGMRFKPESSSEGNSVTVTTLKDDDYDILKEGQKQSEGRVHKALARVKSMVQYPEARDQYRRMPTVMQEMEQIKSGSQLSSSSWEAAVDMDIDLFDLDALLDDASFMPE